MEQMLFRASEVSKALDIGKSKAYELMASGELETVRIGRSVRATAGGIRKFIERLRSADDGAEI